MTGAVRDCLVAVFALAIAAGCGGSNGNPADGPGICGTHSAPGILNLVGLTPAMGATVNNQDIDHAFRVVRAPAQFNSFTFTYGASHTAGLPTPGDPKFAMDLVGSDIVYTLTIASWSRSPGHVEIAASGGYDLKGCSWSFPSPLFSYDVVGGPDGSIAIDASVGRDTPAVDSGPGVDAAVPAIDAGLEAAAPEAGTDAAEIDLPRPIDVPLLEDGGAIDTPSAG